MAFENSSCLSIVDRELQLVGNGECAGRGFTAVHVEREPNQEVEVGLTQVDGRNKSRRFDVIPSDGRRGLTR